MKFKIGDRVIAVGPNPYIITREGWQGEVIAINYRKDEITVRPLPGFDGGSFTGELDVESKYFALLETKSNIIMNLKEKFVLALTAEPEKSFRKAGITNGDGILTDDGAKIFLTWLLGKNSKEFKTEVVDALLKENETQNS